MEDVLHGDFETRSCADIKKTGVTAYGLDPSTRPWMLALKFNEEPTFLWHPGEELPARVVNHVVAGGQFWAHNAPFELAIWNHVCVPRFGFPRLRLEQLYCTMAMCHAMGLPGGLGKAAEALSLPISKDMDGRRLMLQMAKPRALGKKDPQRCTLCYVGDETCPRCYGTGQNIKWWDDPDRIKRLGEYCVIDVDVEASLARRLFPLSESEREVWLLDQRINQRGIAVNLQAVNAALAVVALERERLDDAMKTVTDGSVATCSSVAQMKAWATALGVDVTSVGKADVVELLKGPTTPELVRAALLIRQEAAKSSTAKLKAMRDGACPDWRLRDLYQYHGAHTGRASGRRVQTQNMIRKAPIEFVFELLAQVEEVA